MLEENKIMADALRKIGEIAVPPDAKLRDWKDALQRCNGLPMKRANVLACGDAR